MRTILFLLTLTLTACGSGLEEVDSRPLNVDPACQVHLPDGTCKPGPKA
jgi:hypothetical protein